MAVAGAPGTGASPADGAGCSVAAAAVSREGSEGRYIAACMETQGRCAADVRSDEQTCLCDQNRARHGSA